MYAIERLTIAGREAKSAPIGEAALLLTFGDSISTELNRFILCLTDAVLETEIAGVVDVVPAYASLLVAYDPLSTSFQAVLHAVKHVRMKRLGKDMTARHHTVPVVYGGEFGPDLSSLAALHGLDPDEVIRIHTGRDYRVYFLGFMPGFAYMGPVAAGITTPRLPTPRPRVPAGSVGIAGSQTGIYPFASPGGWNIIGRTSLQLWDLTRETPALLAPGDTVRLVQTSTFDTTTSTEERVTPADPRLAIFRVRQPGTLSTVQDFGRPGFGRYGLPSGGALDPFSLSAANAVLGNRPHMPALEVLGGGLDLDVLRTTVIATMSGAGAGCLVDGQRVVDGMSWLVRAGQRLSFACGPNGAGASYLAVAGGIEVPLVLGSGSTLLQAGFGGYEGRPVRSGDVLGAGVQDQPPSVLAGRGPHKARRHAEKLGQRSISIIPYSGSNSVEQEAFRRFLYATWRVSARSNRMGTRLERANGDPLPESGGELLSFGVVRGAIQLPPGGEPIVLGPDHGTTGGYPLLGVVPRADWGALAQLVPGDIIRFRVTTIEDSVTALSDLERGM